MIDTLPCDVRDVQKAVNTPQVNERAIIGDVLNHSVQHLAFGQAGHEFRTGFRTSFFQNARRDTTMLLRCASIFRI